MSDKPEENQEEEKEAKPASSMQGLTVKFNGQKLQLPIQASTLAGMLAVGYQAFIGFHEIQDQVARTSDNVVVMAGKLDDLAGHVTELDRSFSAMEPAIMELESQHESDVRALEREVEKLKTCIIVPERCNL